MKLIQDYAKSALRNIRRRSLRSWLTVLGIVIGISAVVALISLAAGLQTAISDQFLQLGADRIIVQGGGGAFGPPGASVVTPITKDDLEVVRRVQGVEEALGRIIQNGAVEYRGTTGSAFIASMPQTTTERDLTIRYSSYKIEEGRMIQPQDRYQVIIGHTFTDSPVFGETLKVRDRIIIEGKEFTIIGALERTGSFQTDFSMIINEDTAREIFDKPTEYSVIQAQVGNVEEIDLVVERIEHALRRHRNVELGREDFQVGTSQDALATINTVLSVVTIVVVGIASISLLVGGVGVMNTMYTSVLERTREIGIMKSVGARNQDVFYIFLFESGYIGLVGGLFGIIIGGSLAKGVEIIGSIAMGPGLIQASITPSLIIGTLLFSFIVGALAGTLPALQASKLNPVEALRR